MATTVGLSRPRVSGLAPAATSVKLIEPSGLATPEVLAVSSCSPGLGSASFHSPVSVSRVNFQELVGFWKVAAMDRIFSILWKSLFNHWSGLGSILERASE